MGSKGICTFYITNVISVFVREGYNILFCTKSTDNYQAITPCKKAGKKADEKSPRVSFFRIYYFTREKNDLILQSPQVLIIKG